jgi:hypothetical protein
MDKRNILLSMTSDSGYQVRLLLGQWTPRSLDGFLQRTAELGDLSARIEFISGQFLGVPYGNCTLVGSPDVAEVLVVNLEAVDCFTYLDYVEAMRLSASYAEFMRSLMHVRYRSGLVAYCARNHFFSDWIGSERVKAISGEIGGPMTKGVRKTLNVRSDGSCFLPGIPAVDRIVHYVPSSAVQATTNELRTGDYVGTYAEPDGLDVSHVGIIIKAGQGMRLRHASSVYGRVVDEDFAEYEKDKPGIVVLRPRT